jgi:phosphate:Na+ symporter
VTALISSIGTSVNARRASMIHLLFNVTGACLFTIMLLIWSKGVVGADFYEVTFMRWFPAATTQIAMFHTFFNVSCTLLFLPLTKVLVVAASHLIREKKQTEKEPWELVFMDKRFLATPAVALGQLKKEIFRMADMAMVSLKKAFGGFIERDIEAIGEVTANNETVVKIGEQISNYLVQVSASGVSIAGEKEISEMHNDIGDIARIAEIADNFTKYTRREVKDNLVFSEGINAKLEQMHAKLHEQYDLVKKAVLNGEKQLAVKSDELEEEIDGMRRELVAEHIIRLGQGKCRPENNTIFINLVSNLERVGDHLNYIVHNAEN